jgi:hypothetical protein
MQTIGLFLTTYADIKKQLFSNVEKEFNSAGVAPQGKHHKEGAAIIQELFKKASVSPDAYNKLAGGQEAGEEFLKKGLFTMHMKSGRVTYSSPLIRAYCQQEAAKWIKT